MIRAAGLRGAAAVKVKQWSDAELDARAATAKRIGLRPGPQPLPYAASKAAVVNMTKTLAWNLGPDIRVNAVAPGWMEGDWMKRMLKDKYDDWGLDVDYIKAWGTWFEFLRRVYWRIECEGMEHVPQGRALFVSNHRHHTIIGILPHIVNGARHECNAARKFLQSQIIAPAPRRHAPHAEPRFGRQRSLADGKSRLPIGRFAVKLFHQQIGGQLGRMHGNGHAR